MEIKLHGIPVRDVIAGYKDSAEEGVVAYGGRLDIRPPYQREFVYKDKQRDAVLETIKEGLPLNTMYWAKTSPNTFEMVDGQQRTISFCQYINGDFSIDERFFHNLTDEEMNQILNYELMIFICEGTDKERLDWFEKINIAGARLTKQELRNVVYTGPWLSDARATFSKTGCVAFNLANDGGKLIKGELIRQEYLETVLEWISDGNVEEHVAIHQHDQNADELWQYYKNVIEWTRATFTTYRKDMSKVKWGRLYNEFKDIKLNPKKIEAEIVRLMQDEDVSDKDGIYDYVLTRNERSLSLRSFTDNQKVETYERQQGICPICDEHFEFDEMEGDHTKPWNKGGRTVADNCTMLCKRCNRTKGGV